jgi:hypothetical protein
VEHTFRTLHLFLYQRFLIVKLTVFFLHRCIWFHHVPLYMLMVGGARSPVPFHQNSLSNAWKSLHKRLKCRFKNRIGYLHVHISHLLRSHGNVEHSSSDGSHRAQLHRRYGFFSSCLGGRCSPETKCHRPSDLAASYSL